MVYDAYWHGRLFPWCLTPVYKGVPLMQKGPSPSPLMFISSCPLLFLYFLSALSSDVDEENAKER
jgi:hypothetical protein